MAAQPVRYRVWVGGLPRDITQEDLYEKFSKYGNILDVTVRHSESDTYAFITYAERRDAEEAIARMDRSCAWGPPVKVNISKDFPPNGPRRRGPDGKPINTPPPVPQLRTWSAPRRHSPLPSRRRRSPSRSRRRRARCDSRRQWRTPPRGNRGSSSQLALPAYGRRSPTGPPAWGGGGVRAARRGYSPPPPPLPLGPYGRPPPGGYSDRPPPSLGRSPLPMRSAPPIGRHRITIENIPDDMSWLELKDLGKEYGSSVTFSRTYCRGRVPCGMLEYADPEDARRALEELDGRRIEGGKGLMRVTEGDGSGP